MDDSSDKTEAIMSKPSNDNTTTTVHNASNDNSSARILNLSDDRDRKVTVSPTENELLAAEGLLEFSREIRIFPTEATSSGTRRNSILSSRIHIPNLSSAGVVADKDQNVYLSYSPYTTATSLQEANDTFSPIRLQNAKGSLSFPPLYPISARQNKAKEDNTATSTLWPSLHSFFLPSLASTVNEREEKVIEGTILGLKQEEGLEEPKAVVGNSKYYLNKVSKKRIADQAYLKKKADVYQNLQRFKDN